MIPYIGDFTEDDTVYHYFNTFSSDDPAASVTITNLVDADLKVHKDGNTTQAVTDGATISIDFDTITGTHLVTIDTSADAFYVTGSDYMVRMEGTTVDGGTINAALFTFSIQNRYSAGALRPTTAGRTLDVTASGAAGIDWGNVENAGTTVDLSATSINLCDTVTTNTDMRGTDSAYTGTPPTAAAIADAVCDEALSGHTTAGTLGKAVADIETDATAILADTNELQTDDVPGLIAGLNDPTAATIADAVLDEALSGHTTAGTLGKAVSDIETDATAILADTNELQVDWVNGGRLDLILDGIDTEIKKLTTTAHSEPTGVPAANEAPIDKLGYLFMALRNQVTVTSTKKTFFDDGGSAEWEKDLSDDGTTYTETEGNAI